MLHGIDDLRYEEVDKPECPKGWAIIKVKAAGICSSDIARIFTKGTYHFPTIPGHEFSGIVDSVSDDEDVELVGKKVGVFPLIPCRKCPQCLDNHFEMCTNYDYLGSRRDGGFAEYVVVPVWNLIPLDDHIPFTSAAMLEPLSVALHAIRSIEKLTGQEVGIIGTGMIGICAAQWAYKLGASKVTIIGRNEQKRSLVEACGVAYDICNDKSRIEQYDIVLEAVGSPSAIELAIYATKPAGQIILMGNPCGDISFAQDTYWRILRKQISLKGTWNSSYACYNASDWTEAVKALSAEEVSISPLISHCYGQNELMVGLKLMQNHEVPYCKVMTVWND